MAHLLKQSTAYTFRLGPFFDSTDGNTQENSLTIAATDVLLSKAGGALAAKNEATALTGTGANAHYTCILNTTDTGTLGTLRVWSHITGALAVWQDFMVLPANVYDSLVAGSDVLDVSATQLAGQVITAAAGVTFPTSIASPTNITAATGIVLSGVTHTGAVIPTVTTVTNDVGITQAAADKAWSTATRLLTAGTNIVLAKGVGVTGFNDLSAAQVNTEADTAIADARLDELLAADSDIDGLTPPTVGSVFHELMTKTAGSFTYDQTTDSLEALRDRGDAAWITATGFSTHSAADVWAVATRVLTAGTNIVLAKGTGVTGFNDIAATDVWAAATRTLTAGTNIVLAKGVGVTGFNDLSSGDAATAIWNAATATYGSAGSYGLLVETNLDAAITSRSSHTAANVWSVATRALTDKVDFSILAANRATLVDEIWDEDVDITHQTAGTAGKKLDDAGAAADPWSTAIPGAYGAGTAGNILGNRLVGTIATGTHNPQSGDAYAIVNHITYGNSAIETLVDDLETRCTELRLAELDAANLPTDVANVQADTDNIQTRLPAALTADGNIKGDILRINGVVAAATQLAKSAAVIISGAAIAGTLSTTQMTTDLTEATDDHYNGRIIIWTSGTLLGQATNITDYTGATKLLTYTAITEAPLAGDTFVIV